MKTVTLREITLNITDGKHGDCEPAENSGYYFVSCKDVNNGTIDYANARQISERAFLETHKRTQLEPNDILITNSGTIGRMALVKDIPETYRTTFQKSVAIVKPDISVVLPTYLYYKLQNCVTDFVNCSNGSAQKNLLLGTMRKFQIDLHEDFAEQERLSSIFAAYDNLIENNQKQVKLLEEAAQRLYKEWFVDLRFPGHEETPIVDGVPAGWERKSLSSIADVIMGQSPKSEFYNHNHEGLPFHQGVGTYGERFVKDDTYSTSFTRIAEAGSILFSVRAPVGRLNQTKNRIVIGRGLAAINHLNGFQSYLFYLLKEHFFKEDIVGNGSIFASITKDELLHLKFVVPTNSIAEKYNFIARSIDKEISVLDAKIAKLKESRDRLLPKLMSGEIEV